MTTQHEQEILTRAPVGGIVGLNGILYDGGEFLPMSARGGNRGQAARDEIEKKKQDAADATALLVAEGKRQVEAENRRRSVLSGLVKLILREVENEENRGGFWHSTAQNLHIMFPEWKQWDGVTFRVMDRSWQTGTLSVKWAKRIAQTDAEFNALISDV